MVAQNSTPSASPRGRRSGGTRSREDILKAARTLFSERGFEGASVRAIASQAKVDPALVRHFFGSKEALFLALLDEIADHAEQTPVSPIPGTSSQGVALVTAYLQMWESNETGPLLSALVRSALASADANPTIKDALARHLMRSTTSSALPTLGEASAELLGSQLLGLAVGRYLLGLPHLAALSTDEVIERTAPFIQGYFDSSHRAQAPTSAKKPSSQPQSLQEQNVQE
ncbi:hypothetical protein A7979_08750 [Rothia nasimurium]|uniref:HTH tetR-type domain-containing protein n=1 Tax=Rothia nasimurium TaxID=85336 RepID=A0A1Y1RTP6_9MICC|nr:TetR family transcriptional regulator [Rothia nasimurium]ORC25088.1 hypothetical protein A7979_08750 [Rothia nasimurium]